MNKEKKEKEYLGYLSRTVKEGVNSSYKPPPTLQTVITKVTCPECGSNLVKSAGYGNRLECTRCGKVFS